MQNGAADLGPAAVPHRNDSSLSNKAELINYLPAAPEALGGGVAGGSGGLGGLVRVLLQKSRQKWLDAEPQQWSCVCVCVWVGGWRGGGLTTRIQTLVGDRNRWFFLNQVRPLQPPAGDGALGSRAACFLCSAPLSFRTMVWFLGSGGGGLRVTAGFSALSVIKERQKVRGLLAAVMLGVG